MNADTYAQARRAEIRRSGARRGRAGRSLFGLRQPVRQGRSRQGHSRARRVRAVAQRRGPSGIRMLFQHDPAEPIGVWTEIKEDARGLFVRGRLAKDVGTGARNAQPDARRRAGRAVDRLSRGAGQKRSGKRHPPHLRSRPLGDIGGDVSDAARRARRDGEGPARRLPTIREFECWLTRDAGLTRGDARAVIAKGFASLVRARDAAPETRSLAERIREATRMINGKGKLQK